MNDSSKKEPWHLDRKVPITLIVMMLAQTAGLIVWGAQMDQRVADHERRIAHGELLDDRYGSANADLCQRLARLEEKIGAQLAATERLETLVRDHMNSSMNSGMNGGRK